MDEELKRVTDAIVAVGISDTLADRLKELEAERTRLQDEISIQPEKEALVPEQIPDFGARWRNLVSNLGDLQGEDTSAARDALRGLLGTITLHPTGDHLEAELRLEAKRLALMASLSGSQINSENLVAGAGFEPATFGL